MQDSKEFANGSISTGGLKAEQQVLILELCH
jgi:hypothetical protein